MLKGEINIPKSAFYQDVFFLFINRDSLSNHKNNIKLGIYSEEKLIETVEISFLGDKL